MDAVVTDDSRLYVCNLFDDRLSTTLIKEAISLKILVGSKPDSNGFIK